MACFIECRHDDAVLVNEFCPTFEHGNIFLFDDLTPKKYQLIQDMGRAQWLSRSNPDGVAQSSKLGSRYRPAAVRSAPTSNWCGSGFSRCDYGHAGWPTSPVVTSHLPFEEKQSRPGTVYWFSASFSNMPHKPAQMSTHLDAAGLARGENRKIRLVCQKARAASERGATPQRREPPN